MALFVSSVVAVGVIVFGWQYPGQWSVGWIVTGLVLVIFSIAQPRRGVIAGFGIVLGIALLMYGRISAIPNPETDIKVLNSKVITVTGVAQVPQPSTKTVKIILSKVSVSNGQSKRSVSSSILLEAPLFSPINYGDELQVEGKFMPAGQEKDLGYRGYLLHHRIAGTIIYPKWTLVAAHQGNLFVDASWRAEQNVERRLNYLLPQDEAGLVVGIVLGIPRSLSSNLSQALKATGTTHIVVASGYNLSIIIALCANFAKWLGKSKTILLATILVVCYILVSGANPSILRAAVMASLTYSSMALGRQRDALRLLIAGGLTMLLVNPLWVFDTSFQLSFAATLGILLFQQRFGRSLQKLPTWINDSVSTTAAAQVLVWPILVATFGSISLISLLTNALVLWAVPFIMAGGAVLIVSSLIWQPIALVVSIIIHPLLAYTKVIIETCSLVPFASVNMPLGWIWILVYYLISAAYVRWRLNHAEVA